MGINITQFAPPSTVSNLVWDKNMEPPAGKVFEGDLVGDVTGDVSGDLTGDVTGVVRGSLLGYLSRNGVVNASSGTLLVQAFSSVGDNFNNALVQGGGIYAIVDNTQKCFLDDPCNIPVVLSAMPAGYTVKTPSYAESYTSDHVLIDSISESGDLNIYGATSISLNGGTCWDGVTTQDRTISIAAVYIDAGTSLILGDDTPPDGPKVSKLVWDSDMVPAAGKKFNGNLTGNVTGNVSGKIIVSGCSWGNNDWSLETLQVHGLVPIIPPRILTGNSTTPTIRGVDIYYPYLGVFDFQPKPATPALTFTVKLAGASQSPSIYGQLDVYAADTVTLLRSYRKDSAIGTFTFPVDLTDAYRLLITAQGATDTTVTASINSLYVKLPYSETLVDI